jgi:copper chaperone CopZ
MMKMKNYCKILCLVLLTSRAFAQTPVNHIDSTTTIKVQGACMMCKERIEQAANGKGVKHAEWDVDSKILALTFDKSATNLDKIIKRIVDAGHDADNKKAKDIIYNELPECCRYREQEASAHNPMASSSNAANLIRGIVMEIDKKGQFNPLENASLNWLGTNNGTLTDKHGYFQLQPIGEDGQLVVSYVGFQSDTIAVGNNNDLKIIMASKGKLKDVVVTSSQRASYIATISPIRTEVITAKELLKAACCNLSESFETNPSVDVSYNDAVTGSKQIQLLGLSGNYTQLTVENLPGPRGLATPLGLNAIAGPWIESIQLTKGTGSVANGYESIAGQINVELKKPENSEQLLANIYVNEFGKTDLNLNLSTKINKKWSAGLLLHDNFLNNKTIDFNKDGFRDLPTGNQYSIVNRYKYDNGLGWMTQFGFKVMKDKREGGQVNFNEATDKYTTNSYGLGINTDRYEAFAKIGYVFPQKVYKSIGLQIAGINHSQDSYFGFTNYTARQQSFYSNLIYQSIIGTSAHKFRTGFSFQYDDYQEIFKSIDYSRKEIVPGGFFEYTFTPDNIFTLVAGLRADHHNIFGTFITPRLNLRFEPAKGTIIRISAGRGQRTANIFAENMGVFVSARTVNIIAPEVNKPYGLNAEVAWNKGIGLDQKFRLFGRDGMFSIDAFSNDFTNQVVVDIENARQVKFYNLKGTSSSTSFQTDLTISPIAKLDIRMAYRYFNVLTTYDNKLLQRPFISSNRAFLSIDYTTNNHWKFDYTLTRNGEKRIPGTTDNPVNDRLAAYSPAFVLMSAQISKSVGTKRLMDFYIGTENMTNFFQEKAIIAADQPFSNYFDASMIWGPVNGRMIYAGWRLKIK